MRKLIFLLMLASCNPKTHVRLTNEVDPNIVIVNIENGDRAFIGNLLLSIDSCKPLLIGIDGWFLIEKDQYQDSVLMHALKNIKNEILGYTVDSASQILKSHNKFTRYANDEGLAVLRGIDGISSHITPLITIDNKVHENFALRIVKKWKPNLSFNFKVDESIPIELTRTLEQFVHFNGSDFNANKNRIDIADKIVLLGYIGPTDEDKHFTPIRETIKYKKTEPDTYGVVLIANEIRTILRKGR